MGKLLKPSTSHALKILTKDNSLCGFYIKSLDLLIYIGFLQPPGAGLNEENQ
jgi:hypothetical protein